MTRLLPIVLLAASVAACGATSDPSAATDDDDTLPAGPFPQPGSSTSMGSGASTGSTTTAAATGDASEATASSSDTGGVTGGTTTGGSTSGGSSTGGDPLSIHDDEFDDAATLSDWTFRHQEDGEPAQYSTLDIDASEPGHLTVIPETSGWYDDYNGIFMFRLLSGDFLVETSVEAGRAGFSSSAPTAFFNSAGLLVRDPDSGTGTEDWVMHNVGYQNNSVATEGKTTENSLSVLVLVDGPRQGRLRMCRVGEDIVLTRRMEGDPGFTETHRYARDDFPSQVQVGLVVNGWNSQSAQPNTGLDPDIEATFDYIRFRSISSDADCLAE